MATFQEVVERYERERARQRNYGRAKREKRIAAGVCTQCGKNQPREGHTICTECTKYFTDYARQRLAEHKRNGLCYCGRPLMDASYTTCRHCREKVRRYYLEKKRQNGRAHD